MVANHNSAFLLVLVSSLLDLRGGLAGDTGGAAERGHGVLRGGAPDVVPDYNDDYNDDGDHDAVPLPRLLPEQQDGGAGQEAGEQAVERAALAEALCTLVNLTEAAAGAAQADLAVTTAVEEALLPSCFR